MKTKTSKPSKATTKATASRQRTTEPVDSYVELEPETVNVSSIGRDVLYHTSNGRCLDFSQRFFD